MRNKRLLVVPHFPSTGHIATRGEFLARGLSGHFEVSILNWRHSDRPSVPAPLRLISRASGLAQRIETKDEDSIRQIATPLLYARRLDRALVRRLNTFLIRRIVERFSIDVVLNEMSLFDCERLGRPYFLDIVDLPSAGAMLRWKKMAARASGVITITEGVREGLQRFGIESAVIGNGADVAKLRGAKGDAVRETYGLAGRLAIVYIGNHAEWSGLVFLLDVFRALKARRPEAVLVVVGPGSEIPAAKEKVRREGVRDVIFTGPVPVSEVAAYFAAADLGVLPFEQDPHANLSFPIKVIEYNASRKIVVATPLTVLQKIGFPGVVLVERDVAAWVDQIDLVSRRAWDPNWDASVEPYDWRALSNELAQRMNARLPEGK